MARAPGEAEARQGEALGEALGEARHGEALGEARAPGEALGEARRGEALGEARAPGEALGAALGEALGEARSAEGRDAFGEPASTACAEGSSCSTACTYTTVCARDERWFIFVRLVRRRSAARARVATASAAVRHLRQRMPAGSRHTEEGMDSGAPVPAGRPERLADVPALLLIGEVEAPC